MTSRNEKYIKEISIGDGHELRRDHATNEWYMWVGGVSVNKVSEFQAGMIDATITATMIYMQSSKK